MSEFFKSAPVRAAMAEIQQLQEDIMTGLAINGMRYPCLLYTSPSPRDCT